MGIPSTRRMFVRDHAELGPVDSDTRTRSADMEVEWARTLLSAKNTDWGAAYCIADALKLARKSPSMKTLSSLERTGD